MPLEIHVAAQEELPDNKLNLYSMARIEALLATSRTHLRFVAGRSGTYYHPFEKQERDRPFQKKFKPLKKRPRIIDNPDKELKILQSKINEQLLKSVTFPHYLCGGVPGKSVLDNVLM